MQCTRVGERLIEGGIGISCGVVAGLIGNVQWTVTERDVAARLAAFHAAQMRHPDLTAITDVVQGTLWFWLETAPIAISVVLIVCLLAAWLAAAERRRALVMAAWVAATVGGSTWSVVTLVAAVTVPVPDIMAPIVTGEFLLGLYVFAMLIPFAPVTARLGLRAKPFFARGLQVH